MGSGAVAQRLTWSPCGVWNLPGPGMEPMSPTLAGGIPTHWTAREVPIDLFVLCCFLLSLLSFFFFEGLLSRKLRFLLDKLSALS